MHVLDPSRMDLERPRRDLDSITRELRRFDPQLAQKPRLTAIGKMDLPQAPEALAAFRAKHPRTPVIPFSSFSGEGLGELRRAILEKVKKP